MNSILLTAALYLFVLSGHSALRIRFRALQHIAARTTSRLRHDQIAQCFPSVSYARQRVAKLILSALKLISSAADFLPLLADFILSAADFKPSFLTKIPNQRGNFLKSANN